MITDYTECSACHTRVIYPVTATGQKLPPANFGPDPAGQMAIQHSATGDWLGRFLARDEEPIVPEKRFAVHECDGTRRAAQRQQWREARAAVARARRNQRHRPRPAEITGVRIPPPTLPGMDI